MRMRSEPRFILSKKAVLEQYKILSEIVDQVSYSFKTNEDVGRILCKETKSDFSVHSASSIDKLGCPERIWFFAQSWDEEEIDDLMEKNVRRFVVDNENDLKALIGYIKKKDIDIELLLRMRLKEHTIHTGKHFVYGMFSEQVRNWIPKLREISNIKVLGIHFHRKTQNISEWSLKYELETSLPIDILGSLDIVNIGGGIPSRYKNFRQDVVDGIFLRIKELKAWLNSMNILVIAEPGRFIAAPAAKLETTIVNIYDNNIIINASIYQGAMDTFISNIRLLVEGELSNGDPWTIKGKTPDSPDIFRYRVFLKDPKVGDKIIFLNAGAYTFSTDFCGLQKVRVDVVD